MGRRYKGISLKDITYGVFGTIVDILIWQVALVGTSVGKIGSKGVFQAFREADEILENINHKTLSTAWYRLNRKRLLTYHKRNNLYSTTITEYGIQRLNEIIPQYHRKRPWDGFIYLITYDIPQTANAKRDLFREFIKRINCKLLQESTWITPFNPRQLINDYIKTKKIPGQIIVSNVGKDGGIGELTIQSLLVKLYSLENINDRYEDFIRDSKGKNMTIFSLLCRYLSILKDDPQLPFELLPRGWLGDKAFILYESLMNKYRLSHPQLRK